MLVVSSTLTAGGAAKNTIKIDVLLTETVTTKAVAAIILLAVGQI